METTRVADQQESNHLDRGLESGAWPGRGSELARDSDHREQARSQCVHETMNSECESHILRADRERGAVEGNCVAARRGGEQPETEGWSRTKVNSIRHVQRASLLGKGEACRESGESVPVQGLPILETGWCGCGWSGNDRKRAWEKWRDRRGRLTRDGVRRSIVARKPGNAGGAKGPRKVNAP